MAIINGYDTLSPWILRIGFPLIASSGLSFLCLFITMATFLINSIASLIRGGTFFLFAGKICKYLTIAFIP